MSQLLRVQIECFHEQARISLTDLSNVERCLAMTVEQSTLMSLLAIVRNVVDGNSIEEVSDGLFERLCALSATPPVWIEDTNTVTTTACCLIVKYLSNDRVSQGTGLKLLSRPDIPAHVLSAALQCCMDKQSIIYLIKLLINNSSGPSREVLMGFRHLIAGCKSLLDPETLRSHNCCPDTLARVVENGLSAFCAVVSLPDMRALKACLASFVPEMIGILAEETATLKLIPSVLSLFCILLDVSEEECSVLSLKLSFPEVKKKNVGSNSSQYLFRT